MACLLACKTSMSPSFKHNVVALARAAQVLGLPIVAATTARDSMVEVLADNADPKANDVYAALDVPFATLLGQVAAGLAT